MKEKNSKTINPYGISMGFLWISMDVYQFLWISSFLHHSGLPSILYMEKLNNNWTRFSGARKAACTRLAEPCTHQACLDASQDLRDDTHYDTPVQCSSKESYHLCGNLQLSFHLNLVKFMNFLVCFHTVPVLETASFCSLRSSLLR